jgi:hypothetical protein
MKALFVSHRNSLHGARGGQQVCTLEYRDVLRAAGFELEELTYETPRDVGTRLRRRLRGRPYEGELPQNLASSIGQAAAGGGHAFIFCNLKDLIPSGPLIERGQAKLVLLSHGLASVDQLHDNRIREGGWSSRSQLKLARQLQAESAGLPAFDHVFCLSPMEAEITRWLGARSVGWLPRVLRPDVLDFHPAGDRLGCVGTMDHPPNLEGMELFLRSLEATGRTNVRIRLVSRSSAICEDWSRRFRFVDYLGPLGEDEMREEASTWNAFLHPIFCHAMGCSTKLATGLEWGLPVVTSHAGARGYQLREVRLPLADSPDAMVQVALSMLDPLTFEEAGRAVRDLARRGPTIDQVAGMAREQLGLGQVSS